MIAGIDDCRIVELPAFLQRGDDPANIVVHVAG